MAVLKILRNSSLYATREAALAGITTKAATLGDGEMWVATYGTAPDAKSILASKRTWGLTTIDLEAISGDIESQIEAALAELADIAFSGSASDAATEEITASSTTVAVAGTNAADQIADLAETMKSIQDNAGKYKLVQLTAAEVAALSDANVKEAYKVVTFQGEETAQTVYTQVGDTVKIYKDSALQEAYLGSDSDTVNASTGVVTKYVYELISDPTTKITEAEYEELTAEQKALYQEIDSQSMNFVYMLADGTYSMTKIDVSKFLAESEFGDGLEVSGAGVVSVKIDSTSEKLRTSDDVYYTQAECDTANAELPGAVNTISLVTAEEAEAINTALGYTGTFNEIHANDSLREEIVNAYNATLDGAITTADIKTSGESDVLSVSANGVKVDNIQDAIDYAINTLDATAGTTTVAQGSHVAVQVEQENGLVTAVTVTEDGIADAADLEEIERVTSAALNDLETRKAEKTDLDQLAEDALEGVTAGSGINVGVKSNNTQEVSIKLDTVQTDNALSVGANGLYMSQTIDCGTY